MAYDKDISIKMNVDKIVKERLYKGEKGTYLTVTLKPTPDNQYGNDYMVTQYWKDETLPEGEYPNTPILGNGRDLYVKEKAPVKQKESSNQVAEDDLPF